MPHQRMKQSPMRPQHTKQSPMRPQHTETISNAAATFPDNTIANAAAFTYAPLVSPASYRDTYSPYSNGSTDNSTKLATTSFVQSHVATGYAPINSPNFTGIPTAPTPAASTNTTQLATYRLLFKQ